MRLRTFVFALALLATVSCGKTNEAPIVQLTQVREYGSVPPAVYPAKASALDRSSVAFMVSGTIDKIYVKPGDQVKKGTPLASINNRDYLTQLTATRAEYNQIKAEVGRVIAMYEERAVSDNDYDKARYGLEQITQKLSHHTNQVSDCTLRAPYDGFVESIMFGPGETVVSGVPVVSMFASKNTSVVAYISAEDFRRQDLFSSFSAEFSALPGMSFPLTMNSLSPKANRNQLYEMELIVTDTADVVTPGMTAMVSINFKSQETDETVVPMNAVFNDGSWSCVYVYNPQDECIHKASVELSDIDGDGSAIVRGLDPGVQIVSAGVSKLTDGQKVRPSAVPSSSNPGGLL